jgi:hypothetical protein
VVESNGDDAISSTTRRVVLVDTKFLYEINSLVLLEGSVTLSAPYLLSVIDLPCTLCEINKNPFAWSVT